MNHCQKDTYYKQCFLFEPHAISLVRINNVMIFGTVLIIKIRLSHHVHHVHIDTRAVHTDEGEGTSCHYFFQRHREL